MKDIHIVQFSIEEFQSMEQTWRKCLNSSYADPLFLSWIWQSTWWSIWQPRLNLNLFLLGIYNDEDLVGLAPCYTYKCSHYFRKTINRCEFIGNYSHSDDSIRSEYLNFILPPGQYETYLSKIFSYMQEQGVDEIVLTDIDSHNETAKYLAHNFSNELMSTEPGIQINCQEGFDQYLIALGKNTRLKMFNRRKLLGNNRIKKIENEDEILPFFNQLNIMHKERWGHPCFSEHSIEFHYRVVTDFLTKGQLDCLILYNENEPVAISYDISVEGRRYNIQLGFFIPKSNKLSMGTLMLGFAIEQAHQNEETLYYDLLAGNGKNSFYKEKFKGEKNVFVSFRIPLTGYLKIFQMIKRSILIIKRYIK
ncbi:MULTISPECIES: GNAT family N-acetyltransferase [unclassified Colwellia]|uniref:GNAT family N-acetyltransferase n=2 Tax=unclassified Colwellia TaxID=196834 RepID=UPI0015F5CC3C|nr:MULTISPECIES: GNAT family N-acetyltransferase [unclassified Colwellia]MBA6234357.1 GNAT family N-acetyltransferase [Colwellia sp. MB02u-7]MBA6300157.1 GNAT family N-acetyltransferase [Colwellia sp. MB3u-22]MBA6301922.1 GNAT family N-acetyltransferase [Colwellia sp. MB02u-14]